MRIFTLIPVFILTTSGCEPNPGADGSKTGDSGTPTADEDADGFSAPEDCDDNDATVNPDAAEVCDGIDNNCDQSIDGSDAADAPLAYADTDGDGFGDPDSPVTDCAGGGAGYVANNTDCDDADGTINPAATEACTDTLDRNCDSSVAFADADADGFAACEDCDDADPLARPNGTEVCDGADNDCDGTVDGPDAVDIGTWWADTDGDGYGDAATSSRSCAAPPGYVPDATDCDDTSAAYYPGATETCADPNDYNCDGSVGYADADADGFAACEECDDRDASVSPRATEICNLIDDNCDGLVDDATAGDASTWYADADGDGYGSDTTTLGCTRPAGYADNNADCDDTEALAWTGAPEVCDSVDNNCNGSVDEDSAVDAGTWYADADADGYGDRASGFEACEVPAGYVADPTDCDDTDSSWNPGVTEADCTDPNDYNCDGVVIWADGDGDGLAACLDCDDGDAAINLDAAERCDSIDNNCDGTTDEDAAVDAPTWYLDGDSDTYGDPTTGRPACTQPPGWVSGGDDCNDLLSLDHPGATEVCDSADNDCNGVVDDDYATDTAIWYDDRDGDGFGDPGVSYVSCVAPASTTRDSTDCDDTNAAVAPNAEERCNGIDDNCASGIDEDTAIDAGTWYIDGDGDGYGETSTQVRACTQPARYTASPGDCADGVATSYPGATEYCDGADNNCDGVTDEPTAIDATTWYLDADGDRRGDPAGTTAACTQPPGYSANRDDCDDADSDVYLGAAEYCDSIDNNCDGVVDESTAVDAGSWYADDDGDGFGDPDTSTRACDPPSGYLEDDSDCDDDEPLANPDESEACDGIDNNCDGDVDELSSCFPTFDGTTSGVWQTLASSTESTYSLMTYQMSDIPYIYNMYDTTGQRYDPATNTWTTLAATAPYSQPWTSMAPYDGYLWMIRNSAVYRYHPGTDVWTTMTATSATDDLNMTESDEFGIIYGYDQRGYIVTYNVATGAVAYHATGLGGEHETRMAYDPISRAIYLGAYNAPNLYKWDIATGVVTPRAAIGESQLNDIFCSDRSGHIYAAGATSGTTMYQYTIATDTWAAIASLPSDHGNNGSCTVSAEGWLYVGTGSNIRFYRMELY